MSVSVFEELVPNAVELNIDVGDESDCGGGK